MIYNDVELAKHSLDKCWFNFNIIVLTKTCHFYYRDDWPINSRLYIYQPTEYLKTLYGKYSRFAWQLPPKSHLNPYTKLKLILKIKLSEHTIW